MSFGQGLSGLSAASQTLDVIGNNIANSGTVGFKSASATFADVYASSGVGLGTQVSSISQRFTIGTITNTGNQFDLAVDGDKGLFRVLDPNGSILYTRNGQFFPNKEGFIVNAQGYRLTGYEEGGTNIVPVRVPTGNIAPVATTTMWSTMNLDANAELAGGQKLEEIGSVALTNGGTTTTYYFTGSWSAPVWTDNAGVPGGPAPTDATPYTTGTSGTTVTFTGGNPDVAALPAGGGNTDYVAAVAAAPFDPAVASSFTHQLPINIYDSLGNSHQVTQYFAKRPATAGGSEWDVYYRLGGQPLTSPVDGGLKLQFDKAGRLTSPTTPQELVVTPPTGGSPADELKLTVDYANSTQFGGDFTYKFDRNGYATGEYASMSITADGSIVANYTNGQTQGLGYLVLADFANLQGLRPEGGNAWAETSTSGQPILGRPGTNSLALVKSQAVEESNVDLSQELVNMIIAQRTYQANAQAIKTQDQVMQTLINMR